MITLCLAAIVAANMIVATFGNGDGQYRRVQP